MFGVPLLLCETTQTLPYWSLNDFDVFLPRIYQSTIDNSIINFNNAFKPPYSIIWFDVKKKLEKMKLKIIENSSEDILEATKLLYKISNNNYEYNNSEIQKKKQKKKKKKIPYGNIPDSFLEKHSNLIT